MIYNAVFSNKYIDLLYDILQNVSSGNEDIQNQTTRYLIGTVSFIILFSISIYHRKSGCFDKSRDYLLSWGFGVGLFRNFILFVTSVYSYMISAYHVEINPSVYFHKFVYSETLNSLLKFSYPFDHYTQVVSMLLISIAFIKYADRSYNNNVDIYLKASLLLTSIVYVYTQFCGWYSCDIDNNEYLWHVLSSLLLIYPIIVIKRNNRTWVTNIVSLLFGCYLVYDIGVLLNISASERNVMLINSIRNSILNFTPILIAWIYIKEFMLRLEDQTNSSRVLLDMQELFINGASHELASPISGMEGYLKTLNKQYNKNSTVGADGCKKNHICERIPTTIYNLQESVQQIKNVLRIMKDYGHTKNYNEIGLYDVNNLTQKCYNAIEFADSTKKLSKESFIFVDCSKSNSYMVKLSPYKYRQIIENLVSNSVRSLEILNPDIPMIKIILKCMGDNCVIEVIDNGNGMTREELDHCFEKRWTTFENQGGTGLGLYFVKKYIDEMNGSVSINSKKYIGTTVRIILPVDNNL